MVGESSRRVRRQLIPRGLRTRGLPALSLVVGESSRTSPQNGLDTFFLRSGEDIPPQGTNEPNPKLEATKSEEIPKAEYRESKEKPTFGIRFPGGSRSPLGSPEATDWRHPGPK